MAQRRVETHAMWAAIFAGALLVGSIGPWASVTVFGLTASKQGTSGDGLITLALALVAGALALANRDELDRHKISVAIPAILALGVSLYDLIAIGNKYNGIVKPDWGLYLCVAASTAIIAAVLTTPTCNATYQGGYEPHDGS